MSAGRTAPSTSGQPHPGTVLSALLAWVDARARGARFVLRLEDLDASRSKPAYVAALRQLPAWLGIDCDAVEQQSAAGARHAAALDQLAAAGALYGCSCSRQRLRQLATVPELGTAAYDNHCRARAAPLTAAQWRTTAQAVRLRLPAAPATSATPGPGTPAYGDPIVRRRDGVVAYALASVVDDAAQHITHVVRGQDLAVHAPLHAQIYAALGLAPPVFLHHPLLVGPRGDKLAKLHGDVPVGPGTAHADAAALVGRLACLLGLAPTAAPLRPQALVPTFAWARLPAPTTSLPWT